MSSRACGLRAALLLVCLASASAVAAGCGAAGAKYSSMAMAPGAVPAAVAAAPPPLERSLFARNPDGTLSEEQLQTIIDAPIELDLPARVGVLPIMTAQDWRGPSPDYAVPTGVTEFAKKLRASEHFTLVTEIMPIPSGALGMEALREIAARYRLRYIVLYREYYVRQERANGWAWGYATLLGALFLPGETLRVHGYLEASMFDVKTGLLMFTVRRAVTAREDSNVWHQDDKLAAMEGRLAQKFAPELAKDVWSATTQFGDAIRVEEGRRAARANGANGAARANGATPNGADGAAGAISTSLSAEK